MVRLTKGLQRLIAPMPDATQSLQVDIELPLALCVLLYNVTQDKDLVCASLSFPNACVLSSQVLVHCLGYSLDDDLGQDLAGYR